MMIIVTGGAGFIGSAFVAKLNAEGIKDIIIVDALKKSGKWQNLVGKNFTEFIHKDQFLQLIVQHDLSGLKVDALVHMGACASTTEQDADYLLENNYRYTRALAEWALKKNVRFIYASSAATYGDGSLGFSDADTLTPSLRPMNMYGYSKQLFDLWVLKNNLVNKITGIKFFNVFGPNEYHKEDMSSVVFKAFHQIKTTGKIKLFRSYKKEYKHGHQLRDFIYVKDCCEIIWWLLNTPAINGIYNLGTGQARNWNDLAMAIFKTLKLKPAIQYIPMPEGIRDSYQYYTEAKLDKLRAAGWDKPFLTLEKAVQDYVKNHLSKSNPYW